jgi:hypothetical protein
MQFLGFCCSQCLSQFYRENFFSFFFRNSTVIQLIDKHTDKDAVSSHLERFQTEKSEIHRDLKAVLEKANDTQRPVDVFQLSRIERMLVILGLSWQDQFLQSDRVPNSSGAITAATAPGTMSTLPPPGPTPTTVNPPSPTIPTGYVFFVYFVFF